MLIVHRVDLASKNSKIGVTGMEKKVVVKQNAYLPQKIP